MAVVTHRRLLTAGVYSSIGYDTDVGHAEVDWILRSGGGGYLKAHVQQSVAYVGDAGAPRAVPALHEHVREKDLSGSAGQRVHKRTRILFLRGISTGGSRLEAYRRGGRALGRQPENHPPHRGHPPGLHLALTHGPVVNQVDVPPRP